MPVKLTVSTINSVFVSQIVTNSISFDSTAYILNFLRTLWQREEVIAISLRSKISHSPYNMIGLNSEDFSNFLWCFDIIFSEFSLDMIKSQKGFNHLFLIIVSPELY